MIILIMIMKVPSSLSVTLTGFRIKYSYSYRSFHVVSANSKRSHDYTRNPRKKTRKHKLTVHVTPRSDTTALTDALD